MFLFYIILIVSTISFGNSYTLSFPNSYDGACDLDNPCPTGFACRFINYVPGAKACVYLGFFGNVQPARRPGRCPTTNMTQIKTATRITPCNSNEDCHTSRKCCPSSFGKSAFCVQPTAINVQPTVTPIIVGSAKISATQFDFLGSSTLIQSNGFNVLADTSSFRMTKTLLSNLWQQAGLNPDDIDMLVSTHGHPDHYGSAQTFSDISTAASSFTYSGRITKLNPLASGQRYFLNNDTNIEVINTPGHTPQCVSVIVRNVPNLGTVAIVGDLILYKDDGTDPTAYNKTQSEENRKKVACSVDYIVPGHGPMFRMDADQKLKFKC